MNIELIFFCALSFAVVVSLALLFRFRQNKKARMGGAISLAKAYWLGFVLVVWFLWPLFTLAIYELSATWRRAWILFSALIWLRALVEIFMLTLTKNWRPPHGYFSHLATAFCMLVFSAVHLEAFSLAAPSVLWGLCFFTVLLDAFYAFRFHQIVQEKTVGDEGIWFASDDEPRFVRINALSKFWNVLISIWAAAFLVQLF